MDEYKINCRVLFVAKGRKYHRTGRVMAFSSDSACVDWAETTNANNDVIAPLPRWLEKSKLLVLSPHITKHNTPSKTEKEQSNDEI